MQTQIPLSSRVAECFVGAGLSYSMTPDLVGASEMTNYNCKLLPSTSNLLDRLVDIWRFIKIF